VLWALGGIEKGGISEWMVRLPGGHPAFRFYPIVKASFDAAIGLVPGRTRWQPGQTKNPASRFPPGCGVLGFQFFLHLAPASGPTRLIRLRIEGICTLDVGEAGHAQGGR